MSDQLNQATSLIDPLADSFANQLNVRADPDNFHFDDSALGFSPATDVSVETDGTKNKPTIRSIETEPTPLRGKTPGETRFNFIKLKCSVCLEMIDGNLDSLYKHKQVQHGLKPYECLQSDCNARFNLPAQMSAHLRKVHQGVQEFYCELCNKTCDKYRQLYQHHRLIHLKGLFECNVDNCGHQTLTIGKMESYIAKHPKKHICAICEEGFITKDQLKSHEPIHANGSNPETYFI